MPKLQDIQLTCVCSTSLPSRNQVDSSLLVRHTEAVAASPEPAWPAPIYARGPRKDKTEGNNEITMPVPNVKDSDGHMRLHSDLTMIKMISKSEVSSGYPILCEGLKNDEFSENFWNDPEMLWNESRHVKGHFR